MSTHHVDTLIFVSLSELEAAQEIKKNFPNTTVIVLTGLMPENEVFILPKELISPGDNFKEKINI